MSSKVSSRDLTSTESDLSSNAKLQNRPNEQETLREKATKRLHGPDANPSQLGDPISLKAETSDRNPRQQEAGATISSSSPSPPRSTNSEETSKDRKHETLREKATAKLHGPNANPSQLGDPISLKAETTAGKHQGQHDSAPGQEGSDGPASSKSRL